MAQPTPFHFIWYQPRKWSHHSKNMTHSLATIFGHGGHFWGPLYLGSLGGSNGAVYDIRAMGTLLG